MSTLLASDGVAPRQVAANGWRQSYYEAGDPSAPPVMVLHGFPGSAELARPLLAPLVAAGFRVIVPTLRWLTPTASGADYSIPTLADDVTELLRHVSGDRPAMWVTHDFGSLIAYEIANRDNHPQTCRALVTMAIPHPRTTRPLQWLPARLSFAGLSTSVLVPPLDVAWRARHFFTIPLHRADWLASRLDNLIARWGDGFAVRLDEFHERFMDAGVRRAVRQLYADYRLTPVMRRSTKVPTLAFAGTRDGATAYRPFLHMSRFHEGPLHVVPLDAGHFLLDERPEQVVPATVEFLSALPR